MRTFVARESFEAPQLKSVYVKDLSYTIRPNNRYLEALAEVWALEGKIQFVGTPTASLITGKGFTDPTIWGKTKRAWSALWR